MNKISSFQRTFFLPTTLIFHFGKFFVVLLKRFPKFLVLSLNIVHALDFQLELLPQIESWNRI